MRARTILAAVAALAFTPVAQAVEPTLPDFDGLVDYDAVHDLDVLYADLDVLDIDRLRGYGTVRHYLWSDQDGRGMQSYNATVTIAVPSKVPGFETLKAAMNADVRINLIGAAGIPYAECLLAVQPVTSRTFVTYELQLVAHEDAVAPVLNIKPVKGVCDVDVDTPGIQVGIPQMEARDVITGFARYETAPRVDLVRGYCQ